MYLLILYMFSSVWLYYLMYWDKCKAMQGKWRIPERTLFLWALFGGEWGGLLAMKRFSHKTKKPLFKYGFPILAVLHIILLIAAVLFGDVPMPA